MPFAVETISKPGATESVNKSIGQAMRQVKTLTPGQSVIATIGEEPVQVVSQSVSLTEDELKEKAIIVHLLLTLIEPPLLSRKSPNGRADKISFTQKVKGMTLPELRRFIPSGIPPETIDPKTASLDFIDTLERKYKDLSP